MNHDPILSGPAGGSVAPAAPTRRPSRWSPTNWPVRWKVFAIVLVPLLLAGGFGGLRINASASEASELRLAAQRADMIPAISEYMAAFEGAMIAATEGTPTQQPLADFDSRKADLRERLENTDVVDDVESAVNNLLTIGQELINKVMANTIDLRGRVLAYGALLLTSETAVTGSARADTADVQVQAQALSRAIGARGQMALQHMLVTRGGDVPEPELRVSMTTLAGTEPSTVTGMAELLGPASQDAATLRTEMFKRMSMMATPGVVLVGNPELLQSQQVTDGIAGTMIDDLTASIPAAVNEEAAAQRSAAIRDAVLVAVAIVIALAVVLLVASSLVQPLRRLRDSALKVAHEDLAGEIERVRAGGEPGPVAPIPVHTTEEVGQVAHAVDELHEQAVFLAGEQARLQMQVGDMFETLSRRSRSLVDQQLSLIDRLEANEDDPERLESLFRLDHLAARMRRNGANLLVLSGARIPRDQAAPVPVAAIINAAASEVEDYARVITATVPDSEIAGPVAGDLVHLLAELLDNALRYSPPISQVRVSAVHSGNGGLVIEVSDIGLGMTESDLRVANTRLQSGGEVDPYTARHMGLFVVGRLAAQHGLVVRLRATVAEEPNSGTTAGVYVPVELIARSDAASPEPYAESADAPAGLTAFAAIPSPGRERTNGTAHGDVYGDEFGHAAQDEPAGHLNGHADIPISLLPQRNPGASGISGVPAPAPVDEPDVQPDLQPVDDWPEDSMPAQTPAEPQGPSNTSAFFASRAQVASNGVHRPEPVEPPQDERPHEMAEPASAVEPVRGPADLPGELSGDVSETAGSDDAIYQKMLSEWLIDPHEIANSSDLNWESVWDHGWSAAEAADEAPVVAHTEEGLPVRQPGARLVPGGVDAVDGGHRNGGAHRSVDQDDEVASAVDAGNGSESLPLRDPDAVRASISNHFGGVHAGRMHARETRGSEYE
ncbi:HAMP domain-containing protein [Mycobacterium manitobense]|uniref:histidine kinase n=1 Tax=[Mycobacterium] manitobense TaxID=190147 RepID=A0A9X3BXM3_9MYCO|nr:ATP-binding protein [[Mycobacterium] manitobense]MCV7172741.1 HAMP domain-containing protein [[Mycobacterium] manitobense]